MQDIESNEQYKRHNDDILSLQLYPFRQTPAQSIITVAASPAPLSVQEAGCGLVLAVHVAVTIVPL